MSALYRADPIWPPGEGFADVVQPARFPEHILRFRNQRWAARMGLHGLSHAEWLDHFGRFVPLKDNLQAPLAQRYHGHQFRHYNPQLGDGRGFTFGQARDQDGVLREFTTKGSGTTPYSRMADGRLTLKGGVREILATEMLEALGVRTSKTFSVVETGEHLQRHDEPSPTRSCVLVRLSHSQVRFGTFQRHRFEKNDARLRTLLEHGVELYYPELMDGPERTLALRFLEAVQARCAELVASWTAAGFVHGVLNTDNINITAESFDYGPWRFLPRFDPRFTAAYFDKGGLYAFGRQGEALHWNLMRLAECFDLLEPESDFATILARFPSQLREATARAFCRRLDREYAPSRSELLVDASLDLLQGSPIHWQQFFFDGLTERWDRSPFSKHYRGTSFVAFRNALDALPRAHQVGMDHVYFQRVRACDIRALEVEEIWSRIAHSDDWSSLRWKVDDMRVMGAALRGARS